MLLCIFSIFYIYLNLAQDVMPPGVPFLLYLKLKFWNITYYFISPSHWRRTFHCTGRWGGAVGRDVSAILCYVQISVGRVFTFTISTWRQSRLNQQRRIWFNTNTEYYLLHRDIHSKSFMEIIEITFYENPDHFFLVLFCAVPTSDFFDCLNPQQKMEIIAIS